MAKNYTLNEAVNIIANGTNLEEIADIGRRYPVLAHKIAVVTAKAGKELIDLMGYMPDYLTANKVNTAIKAGITESEGENDDEENENEATETKGAAETGAEWNENMSAKQLWDILGKAGKRKLAKSTKKSDLIDACKKAFGETAEAEDVEEEDAAETNPYEGKSAVELFKECKARKIKAAPKKPAKFYADLLAKDDAAKAGDAEAESEEEDEEWGDEEDKAPKAEAKKEKKKEAAKAEKPAAEKKAKAESEDDDDWDI